MTLVHKLTEINSKKNTLPFFFYFFCQKSNIFSLKIGKIQILFYFIFKFMCNTQKFMFVFLCFFIENISNKNRKAIYRFIVLCFLPLFIFVRSIFKYFTII